MALFSAGTDGILKSLAQLLLWERCTRWWSTRKCEWNTIWNLGPYIPLITNMSGSVDGHRSRFAVSRFARLKGYWIHKRKRNTVLLGVVTRTRHEIFALLTYVEDLPEGTSALAYRIASHQHQASRPGLAGPRSISGDRRRLEDGRSGSDAPPLRHGHKKNVTL